MARVGWRMMFHDRLKMIGTLLGVVFAVFLSNQQLATFFGLIYKNYMFADHSGADMWVIPKDARTLEPAAPLSDPVLMAARATAGVAVADPLIYTGATIQTPSGGKEAVTLVGTRAPHFLGGPWAMVAGTPEALMRPRTMTFEIAHREKLGSLNLGSVREVNGRQVVVGGFTWGLQAFAPSYAFAEYELARELSGTAPDKFNYVVIKLDAGADVEKVRKALAPRVPEGKVVTSAEFRAMIIKNLVVGTPIGITFATSAFFGLLIGFIIVALSMFSSVLDHLREFGTLKAIGATTRDLSKLLLVQSLTYAAVGWVLGTFLVTRLANAIRSPQLVVLVPVELMAATFVIMLLICVAASSLALLRIRKLEPGMVFR